MYRMIDASENITLPQTSFAAVIKFGRKYTRCHMLMRGILGCALDKPESIYKINIFSVYQRDRNRITGFPSPKLKLNFTTRSKMTSQFPRPPPNPTLNQRQTFYQQIFTLVIVLSIYFFLIVSGWFSVNEKCVRTYLWIPILLNSVWVCQETLNMR